MEKYTVDSISQGLARLLLRKDERTSYVVPVAQLPPDTGEGDILFARIEGEKVLEARRDEAATTAQRQRVESLLEKLKHKNRPR